MAILRATLCLMAILRAAFRATLAMTILRAAFRTTLRLMAILRTALAILRAAF
ncbi:MAG: hypothetical protein HQL77_03580 [Magnetococcales bacterium]|nr:hypothetical protein [Magnetococcales bacterium]